jgi:hypothetical protein
MGIVWNVTEVARVRLFPKADTEVSSLAVMLEETLMEGEKVKD